MSIGGNLMSNLRMKNVVKTYPNGYKAVDNFNIEIEDKEFIILVGPSGCGKTTTLRMIAGLEEITDGEIWIGDNLVNNIEPKDRNLSMVFQNYALYPHMTVYDNIAFSLHIGKMPKKEIDNNVKRVAKILELDELLDRKPKQLSGGQKQRVAIGSAIARNPKFLLMDEPLSNLDAKLRSQMRVELIRLHKELESTIIYVTHDQTEAMTLGSRIVVMNHSIVQQIGTPSQVYENPDNVFVAGFIGVHAMNFIKADVIFENGDVLLKFYNQTLKTLGVQKEALMSKGYIGQQVIIGIRPEDLFDETESTVKGDCNMIHGTAELREFLGSQSLLYFNIEDNLSHYCSCINKNYIVSRGSKVNLFVKMDSIKIFDSFTEENILY